MDPNYPTGPVSSRRRYGVAGSADASGGVQLIAAPTGKSKLVISQLYVSIVTGAAAGVLRVYPLDTYDASDTSNDIVNIHYGGASSIESLFFPFHFNPHIIIPHKDSGGGAPDSVNLITSTAVAIKIMYNGYIIP